MRTLKFNVNAQIIQKDPNCNFDNIIAGTKDYLKAQFTFSSEWQDCILVASFWRGEQEHAVIISNGECIIPYEALVGQTFRVSVIGMRGDYKITTNTIVVRQGVSR